MATNGVGRTDQLLRLSLARATPTQSPVARALQGTDNWLLTFMVCIAAGLSAGVVYHLIYERPMLRLLSRKAARK